MNLDWQTMGVVIFMVIGSGAWATVFGENYVEKSALFFIVSCVIFLLGTIAAKRND